MVLRAVRRIAICLGAVSLAFLTLAAATGDAPATDPQTALVEGNRLFRNGQVEAAVAAYQQGYAPSSPNPTLLYNLGTALHHLDRLPEAILWYRRAADSTDPWLQDNLWLARRSLGSQVLPPGGSLGWLTRHSGALRLAAIVLAWATLLLVIFSARFPTWTLLASAALACALYGAAVVVDRWGPHPAVVLADCHSPGGELPAGTETWVRRDADGRWRISGSTNATCDDAAIALVSPPT